MLVSILLLSVLTVAIASILTVSQLENAIRDAGDLRHMRTLTVAETTSEEFLRKTLVPYQPTQNVQTGLEAVERDLTDVLVFGGEPLLRAGAIFEIMAEARNLERARGIPVTAKVSTNGVLLDEGFLNQAGRWGVFVSLSIDGNNKAHDLGRVDGNGHGSFRAAFQALQLLVAAGRPFAVYSVITPSNVQHLADSVIFLWNAGARIIVNTVDYTAEWTEGARAQPHSQYQRAGRFYRRQLEKAAFFHMEPFDSRIPAVTRPKELKRCRPGLSQVVVAPDGTLYGSSGKSKD